jgi:acyl carrier protein
MAIVRRLIDWLTSGLGADGLDTTDYVEHIEREFGIVIRDDAVGTLGTLGKI